MHINVVDEIMFTDEFIKNNNAGEIASSNLKQPKNDEYNEKYFKVIILYQISFFPL